MWQQLTDPTIFGNLEPVQIFIENGNPLVFSICHNNRWFYIHQFDQDAEYTSYFARETNESELAELESNKIELKTFLKESQTLYVLRYFGEPKPVEAYIVNPNDFSDSYFPTNGTYLYHTQLQSHEDQQ